MYVVNLLSYVGIILLYLSQFTQYSVEHDRQKQTDYIQEEYTRSAVKIPEWSQVISVMLSVGRFDAVVDFSAYSARAIREATTLLRHKAHIYVHISTDSVYDVCDPDRRAAGPVREEDSVRPDDKGLRDLLSTHHDYGHRKLEAEEELVTQRYNHSDERLGIPYVILRLPDVLGPRDTTYRFWLYQLWVRLAAVLPERPVTIPKFLVDQENSFVFVDDVAKVVVDAVEAGPNDQSFTDQVVV